MKPWTRWALVVVTTVVAAAGAAVGTVNTVAAVGTVHTIAAAGSAHAPATLRLDRASRLDVQALA